MFRTVELPLWLLVLILGFALVTFASHFLFPSVRWFFRRRAEAAVARLNKRLARPIEPFKLARRHDTIQRLIYDPGVIEAVAERACEAGIPQEVAHQEARRYAREIVPAFSASAYFGFGTRAARWLSRMLYRVRIGHVDEAGLAALPENATVVFVMNHRSNMDYVLVTYLAAQRSATLSYAVGEWARVWPLSVLIRSMGAYFIRRSSRNALYRRVLARYVQIATAEGVTQAVFPEGGLSLDGRVGRAKLGILSYVAGAEAPGREVWFVPVALNYDRVIEDRFLVAAHRSGKRRFPVPVLRTLGYVLRRLWQKLRGTFLRYGYVAVSFGAPIPLAAYRGKEAGDATAELAEDLMQRIRELVPVLPVPLLARVLLRHGDMDRKALEAAFAADVEQLRANGVYVHVPRGSIGLAVRLAQEHLVLRGVLTEDGDVTRITERDLPLLAYYAASIAHHFPDPAAGVAAPAKENAAFAGS
ncbi:1-acyl-sn-glycerol-3-phosphate acyltransferase [Frigidibacter sp. ROC022]|uniref:1-acyl-sn-glycerol-3-phosphate acyltransferase n=1 Tax=Frigidibacter sp. ROC022 TaxID=2971796 RepID=UPI00215B0264|nr:1-acyl-sn-glycerol-3-phosphate acyltransferase [Frigidibacter sp. ROC022]MCR8725938.1 1-acyl-sn-glycerol-3-phosphate acyltransferase [Frigidibacter sp. ROC022]